MSRDTNAAQLADIARKENIKSFLVSFTDLKGVQRAKMVPASAIGSVAKSGAGFAPAACQFATNAAAADLLAYPDPTSLIKLPWKPEVAWVASDLYIGDAEFMQSPRRVLGAQLARAADMGMIFKVGIEPEFMLLELDESGTPYGPPIAGTDGVRAQLTGAGGLPACAAQGHSQG